MADHKTDVDILFAALKSAIRQPPPDVSCIDAEDTEEEEEEEEEDYDDDDEYIRDDNDDGKAELACPFCSDDYDILGLCCHIDSEHRVETKSGICPLCPTNVGINMAAHVISQHENLLKALSKKKLQNRLNSRLHSGLSLLRKELQNLNLHLHLKESSRADSSSNVDGDRLMLSFVNNPESTHRVETMQAKNSAQTSLLGRSEENNICERSTQESPVDEDQEEKVRRSEFVSGILFSTILDDFL